MSRTDKRNYRHPRGACGYGNESNEARRPKNHRATGPYFLQLHIMAVLLLVLSPVPPSVAGNGLAALASGSRLPKFFAGL